MKVIYNLSRVQINSIYPVVAIGIFDGVHRGHQDLIKKAYEAARKNRGQLIIFTFHPHPVHVLHPEVYLPLIVSLPHRLNLLEALGVDICVVQKFTHAFSRVQPEKFIQRYLVRDLKAKEVFVGDDFRFGADRSGNSRLFAEASKKYGFIFHAIHPVKAKLGKVSSTEIRKLIEAGKVDQAKRDLGRPMSLFGRVIKGANRGRKLGFPTANVDTGDELLPGRGVYAVDVEVSGKKIKGMANVGFRPTFHQLSKKLCVEVHLFNWHQNLYGKNIKIQFIRKIRDERIFSSAKDLVKQLKKDERLTKRILSRV